jgi:two-component system chemotaxis sensor kinase CheA
LANSILNSLDHGIEPPHMRGKKPESATVRLAIKKDDSAMTIEISDDGHGLSRDKIIKAAAQKKLITVDQAKSMTDGDVYRLIFESGLSTADEISDISGRGIGLEAVKLAVQETGGDISVKSSIGEGTTFTIRLPFASQAKKSVLEFTRS